MTALNRVMLVGWGGNNGSTVTAGILANKQCVFCAFRLVQQETCAVFDIKISGTAAK